MPGPHIDLDQYQEGRRDFADGHSLLSIVQRIAESKPADEDKEFSRGLGFVDALVDRLRGLAV